MPDTELYILTGPVQSGKTTSLLQWVKKRKDVYGIFTPVVNGTRVFMNAHTGEQFRMEAAYGEESVIKVGRFVFSKAAFAKAAQIIQNVALQNGWLVIDEIGPLELRGEGFHDVLKEVLSLQTGNILLVVREGLMQQVQDFFDINAVVIKHMKEL